MLRRGQAASYDSDEFEEDSTGKRKPRPSGSDNSWGVIIVLLLALTVALLTRHRSLEGDRQVAAGGPEALGEGLDRRGTQQPQFRRGDAASSRGLLEEEENEEEERAKAPPPLPGSKVELDMEAVALATPHFDTDIHKTYARIPPLKRLTQAELKGGWNLSDAVYDFAVQHPSARVVSWDEPRAAVFRSFLTPQEVGHIIAVARGMLQRSQVVSELDEGEELVDDARTSYGAWPPNDDVFERIAQRVHRLMRIPKEFGEDFHVLNYQIGQRYESHADNCVDLENGYLPTEVDEGCLGFLKRSGGPGCGLAGGGSSCGDRIATVILHLATPQRGGRTVFPEAAQTREAMAAAGLQGDGGHTWYCEEDMPVLGVAPNPGDMTMFWDYAPVDGSGTGSFEDGTADPTAAPVEGAYHSGCPVLEGEKWIATRWIRASKFN